MKFPKNIEIFRAGSYPQGEFTADDVQALVDNYDPDWCDAPVTVDHQQEGPRFGHVSRLYNENGVLKADLDKMPEAFAEQVRQGLYDKRSVEIFRDLEGRKPYLKALTFLGAQTPQVKGLAPISFKDGEAETVRIDFSHEPAEPETPPDEPAPEPEAPAAMSGSDPEGAPASEGAPSGPSSDDARFADLSQKLAFSEARRKEAEKKLRENHIARRKLEFESFLQEQIAMGYLTREQESAVMAILQSLDNAPAFAEQINGHTSPVELFKALLSSPKNTALFRHVADGGPAPEGGQDLESVIRRQMQS